MSNSLWPVDSKSACQTSLSFALSQSLLKFMSIESVMLSNHLILCSPLLLLLSVFPSNRVFSNELFTSDGQSIRASASALVLPMNSQGWLPLGLPGLISLQFKGFSRGFSNTKFENINSLVLSCLYGPTTTSIQDYWKNNSFDYMNLCWQSDVSVF